MKDASSGPGRASRYRNHSFVAQPGPCMSRPSRWRKGAGAWGLAALVSLLAACDSPVLVEGPPRVAAFDVRTPDMPLVRIFDIRLSSPYGVQVDYWTDDGPRLRVVRETSERRHELALGRLRPSSTYHFEVRSSGAIGMGVPVEGSFTTAPLPAGIAVLDFAVEGVPTQPLTLFEINQHPGGFQGVVIADGDGEVVWYYNAGPVGGAKRRENGNFVFLDGGRGVTEVTPGGEVLAQLAQQPLPGMRAHHDVITTPANTLLFISYDQREYDGRTIVGEAIWEWNPDNGDLARRWSSWDEMSPDVDWGPASRDSDWLHANSLAIGPRGNILMSFRFLNQVISIAPDFSHIEWRLGGVNATVEVTGSDVFIGQHTAAELASAGGRPRVLLFDNGSHARGFSRAQELELDLESGTASTVWEFRPATDNLSFIVGSARRLANGNTFVAFGAGPGVIFSSGPVEAYEVDPTGAVQFHIEVSGPTVDDTFILYRASPLSDIAGETVAE